MLLVIRFQVAFIIQSSFSLPVLPFTATRILQAYTVMHFVQHQNTWGTSTLDSRTAIGYGSKPAHPINRQFIWLCHSTSASNKSGAPNPCRSFIYPRSDLVLGMAVSCARLLLQYSTCSVKACTHFTHLLYSLCVGKNTIDRSCGVLIWAYTKNTHRVN